MPRPSAKLILPQSRPNLRMCAFSEFLARAGQPVLGVGRVRMRGAEDSPFPLDHVLHGGRGFEQVVACVEIKKGSRPPRQPGLVVLVRTQVAAGALRVVLEGRS